jgi:hypothetical protein
MAVVDYTVGFGSNPMTVKRRLSAFLILVLSLASPVPAVEARQAPGYSEITAPAPGSAVQGIVTIRGSANHPSFVAYDLAFAYGDDLTETWFPLGATVESPVQDDVLGLWDTSRVSPGLYVLRLRVFLSTGAVLESQVPGLSIGIPTAAPAPGVPTPSPAPALPTVTLPPVAPLPAEVLPAPGDPVASALTIGAAMAAGGLVLLSLYLALQRSLAVWLGGLRMRRVLRGPHRPRPPRT